MECKPPINLLPSFVKFVCYGSFVHVQQHQLLEFMFVLLPKFSWLTTISTADLCRDAVSMATRDASWFFNGFRRQFGTGFEASDCSTFKFRSYSCKLWWTTDLIGQSWSSFGCFVTSKWSIQGTHHSMSLWMDRSAPDKADSWCSHLLLR